MPNKKLKELKAELVKELTSDEWKKGLMIMAKQIVAIPEGEKVGRWNRKDRVSLVYSVLCSLARLSGAPIDVAKKSLKSQLDK